MDLAALVVGALLVHDPITVLVDDDHGVTERVDAVPCW